MLQRGSSVEILDNSGAKEGRCINIFGGFFNKSAKVGNLILITVRKLRLIRKVRVGQMYLAIVIKTRKWNSFNDGLKSKFKKNGVILLTKKKQVFANKINGAISRNLRKKRYMRLLLLVNLQIF